MIGDDDTRSSLFLREGVCGPELIDKRPLQPYFIDITGLLKVSIPGMWLEGEEF